MVSREGLPVSYEVLQDMQQHHQAERTVCVADRGMLSAGNLAALDALDSGYVVGARRRNLPMDLQEKILDLEARGPLDGSDCRRVAEWDHNVRRRIVA